MCIKLIKKRIIRRYECTINIHHVRTLEEGQGLNLGRGTLNLNVIAIIITVICEVFSVVLNCMHILKYVHKTSCVLCVINFNNKAIV